MSVHEVRGSSQDCSLSKLDVVEESVSVKSEWALAVTALAPFISKIKIAPCGIY